MSIAAANLFTRNIWKEYVRPAASDREEASVARWVSLVVKAGALAFVLFLPNKYAIDLQLLGGVWIAQTVPALAVGLLTRWLDRRALLVGWAAGMISGTLIAHSQSYVPTYELSLFGASITAYTAIWALLLNFIVSIGLTLVFRLVGARDTADETSRADYDELVEARPRAPVEAAPTG